MTIAPLWLGLFYGVSEIAISTLFRSKGDGSRFDQGSLRMIWMVISIGMVGAMLAWRLLPSASFSGSDGVFWVGFALFAGGLLLRWYSIAYLGRFFTVDVTVAHDQTVIDTGPYKFIRHPSYTGALLAFVGFAVCLGNWIALLLLLTPVTYAFARRISIEEAALQDGLGEPYRRYVLRTKRLIPLVY